MPKISEATREARQNSIVAAALACLARDGYAGTSMRTIAEAAGLTKGGLYAYFPSKEAILLEVARRYMARQMAVFAPLPGEGARSRLSRMLAHYAEMEQTSKHTDEQRAIMDLWTFAGHLPDVRREMDERYERYLSPLVEVIQQGQASGDFRADANPAHVAGLILAARDGMVMQRLKWGVPTPVVALSALLREAVLTYLAPYS